MTELNPVITSFDDLMIERMEVNLQMPSGEPLRLVLRMLTLREWQSVEIGAPARPKPPITGVDPVTRRPLLDEKDQEYNRALNDWWAMLQDKRLLMALVMTVPGDTEAEQLDHLARLPVGIRNGLHQALSQMLNIGTARLEVVAANFRPPYTHDAGNLYAPRNDTKTVAFPK
jgi:hypothetical protein